jgi:hypothetical protein
MERAYLQYDQEYDMAWVYVGQCSFGVVELDPFPTL